MTGRAIERMCHHFRTKKRMAFEGLKESLGSGRHRREALGMGRRAFYANRGCRDCAFRPYRADRAVIRKDPVDKPKIVFAGLSCNAIDAMPTSARASSPSRT